MKGGSVTELHLQNLLILPQMPSVDRSHSVHFHQ